MAPEMAAADGEHIDERSDVYLLGATLHEILSGQPPHEGHDLPTILTHAFASEEKEYPAHVPAELAAIANKAMQRLNDDRYESAATFADAIDEYLLHRTSIELCVEGHQRLASMSALLRERGELDAQETRELHTLFSECRFGFQQALRSWPDNESAADGLRDSLTLMIDFELGRGAAEAAASLLHELEDPPERLRLRVERALRRQREAGARLKKLELDADLSFGERLRRSLTNVLGAAWALANVFSDLLPNTGPYRVDHLRFSAACFVFMLASLGLALATRRTMLANAANRHVSIMTITNFAALAGGWWMLGQMGLNMAHTNIVASFVGATIFVIAGFVIDRAWFSLAVGNVLSCLGIVVWPEHHFLVVGLFTGASALLVPLLIRERATSPESAPSSDV
jgi:serine/threonine-protein kinase